MPALIHMPSMSQKRSASAATASAYAALLKDCLGGMHFCVTIRGRGRAVMLERGDYLGYIRSMYPLNGPGVAA
jgi:hypothetical protein